MGWAREHCRGDQGWGGAVRIHRSACLWGLSWIPCQVNDTEYRAALPLTPRALARSHYGCTVEKTMLPSALQPQARGGPQEGSAMEGGPQVDLGSAPLQAWNPCLEQSAQQSPDSFCRISLPPWGVALTLTSKMAPYIGYLWQEEVRRKDVTPP